VRLRIGDDFTLLPALQWGGIALAVVSLRSEAIDVAGNAVFVQFAGKLS